jgi:Uma2 family endonuclease
MALSLASLSLAEFLAQPGMDASPAWELLDGCAIEKPMPTLFHSRLQRNLVNWINGQTDAFEAIQELRCLVPPHSPVPDIAVVAAARLGEEDGPLVGAPDWLIEIRSPNQSMLELQNKILYCLGAGTRLAWLIDGERRLIWVWQGAELPIVYGGDEGLPMLDGLTGLTVARVMGMALLRR